MLQAETRQSLNMTNIWHTNMDIQQIPYRPELKGQAHSIHGPIFQHRHVGHYENLPTNWTEQMKAEYRGYKRLEEPSNGTPETADITKDKSRSLARG